MLSLHRITPALNLLLACAVLGSHASAALEWRIETIDTTTMISRNGSLVVDSEGTVHAFYYAPITDPMVGAGGFVEPNRLEIRHAVRRGGAWEISAVDTFLPEPGRTAPPGDRIDAVVGEAGDIGIAYNFVSPREVVKYASLGLEGWEVQEVSPPEIRGRNPALAVDHQEAPHVAFHDNGGLGVAGYYASRGEQGWELEVARSAERSDSFYASAMEIDREGTLHAVGSNSSGAAYAMRHDGQWRFESLGGTSRNMDVALDGLGDAYVARDLSGQDVRRVGTFHHRTPTQGDEETRL